MILLSSADFFQNLLFQKTIRVSNDLDPDIGPHCLQRLSADDKSTCHQGKSLRLNLGPRWPFFIHHKKSKWTSSWDWRSSHYEVRHMRNKNSSIQGRSPYVVKVIFHTIRNCSLRKDFAPSGSKFFPLREVPICKRMHMKRITAWSSSLSLVCVTFSAIWLRHCILLMHKHKYPVI